MVASGLGRDGLIDLASGLITEASRGFGVIVGDAPERVAGRPYADFLLPEAAPAAAATIDALRAAGEVTSELVLRRPDGSTTALEFHATLRGRVIDVAYRPLARPVD